jgi:hypothetical protein
MANDNRQDLQEVSEVFRDSMNRVVTEVIRALEPQLNAIAHDLTNQAIERSQTFFQSAYRESRRHPRYLFGLAAAALVGFAVYSSMSGSSGSVGGKQSDAAKDRNRDNEKTTVH